MILVLAGTSEGRETVKKLLADGLDVLATVTTDYGAELLQKEGLQNIVIGKLAEDGLKRLVTENNIELIMDATHPFALEISSLAVKVAAELGIPYQRISREKTLLPESPLVITAVSLEDAFIKAAEIIEAAEEAEDGKDAGVIFSTLGSKHLPYLVDKARESCKKLVARVLPTPEVLGKCFQLGLTPAEIIAVKGPFSKQLNKALFREYNARVVITKDSGKRGGLQEKLDAALELNIPIIVWKIN